MPLHFRLPFRFPLRSPVTFRGLGDLGHIPPVWEALGVQTLIEIVADIDAFLHGAHGGLDRDEVREYTAMRRAAWDHAVERTGRHEAAEALHEQWRRIGHKPAGRR